MSISLTPPPPVQRVWRSPPPQRWRPPPSLDDWPWYPYPWRSPSRTDESSTSPGKVIVGVPVGVGATLIVLSFVCRICQMLRPGHGASSPAVARAAAVAVAPSRAPSMIVQPSSDYGDDDCSPRRASSTAGLPSFTYSPSLKKNLTGSEEEAAVCAVCLGEFGIEETVRLLPACLHLYHVECIDPWLDAHSTCPICRSGTNPATYLDSLPPPV